MKSKHSAEKRRWKEAHIEKSACLLTTLFIHYMLFMAGECVCVCVGGGGVRWSAPLVTLHVNYLPISYFESSNKFHATRHVNESMQNHVSVYIDHKLCIYDIPIFMRLTCGNRQTQRKHSANLFILIPVNCYCMRLPYDPYGKAD